MQPTSSTLIAPIIGEYAAKFPSADSEQIARHAHLGLTIARQTAPDGKPGDRWVEFCIRQQITRYLSTVAKAKGAQKALPAAAQRRDDILANAFITKYLPMVASVVSGMRSRLPRTFGTADLMGAGRLGLVIAARTVPANVDPEKFNAERWARWCIRRQILNEVCGPSTGRPLGDGKRNQQTGPWVQGQCLSFTQELVSTGGARAAAAISAVQPEHAHERRAIYFRNRTSLSQVMPPEAPRRDEDDARDRIITDAIAELPPNQREIIKLVYEHGIGLRVVGRKKLLGLGWRRVRQEHDAALETLRGKLAA